jgi:hypothetical protein
VFLRVYQCVLYHERLSTILSCVYPLFPQFRRASAPAEIDNKDLNLTQPSSSRPFIYVHYSIHHHRRHHKTGLASPPASTPTLGSHTPLITSSRRRWISRIHHAETRIARLTTSPRRILCLWLSAAGCLPRSSQSKEGTRWDHHFPRRAFIATHSTGPGL